MGGEAGGALGGGGSIGYGGMDGEGGDCGTCGVLGGGEGPSARLSWGPQKHVLIELPLASLRSRS